jgi:hypothetical protein
MPWKSRGSVARRVAGIAGRVRNRRRLVDVVAPVFEALMGSSVQRHHDTFNE